MTRNLHAAPTRFRCEYKPRVIWIDAVCTNQKDDVEKFDQIALMSEIYAYAQRGLIWLGEEGQADNVAFSLLRRLDNFFCRYDTRGPTCLGGEQVRTFPFSKSDLQTTVHDLKITLGEW